MTLNEWISFGVKNHLIEDSDAIASAITLAQLYDEWIDWKSIHTESSAYIRRINDDWNAYYKHTEIVEKCISKIDKQALDVWAHNLIKSRNMTRKQYYNATVIMRQALDYAVDKGYIECNHFRNVNINTKLFRAVPKKSDTSQVFLVEEQEQIEAIAFDDFLDKGFTASLGVLLTFQTGMRISEIVALKWSDIDFERKGFISVQRIEVKEHGRNEQGEFERKGYYIVEHTKSIAGNRNIYLTAKARKILSVIKAWNNKYGYGDSEYIFLNQKGERIHAPALDCRIRKYCRHLGIQEKSMHKIRKTYISTLMDARDININTVREQAGHAHESTTLHNYTFNRYNDDETQYRIEAALTKGLQLKKTADIGSLYIKSDRRDSNPRFKGEE